MHSCLKAEMLAITVDELATGPEHYRGEADEALYKERHPLPGAAAIEAAGRVTN